MGELLAAQGDVTADTGFVTVVELIFGPWGYLTAWFLWRGHIPAHVRPRPDQA